MPGYLQSVARPPGDSLPDLRDDPLRRLRHRRPRIVGRVDAFAASSLQTHRLAQSAARRRGLRTARAGNAGGAAVPRPVRFRPQYREPRRARALFGEALKWVFSIERLTITPMARHSPWPPWSAPR